MTNKRFDNRVKMNNGFHPPAFAGGLPACLVKEGMLTKNIKYERIPVPRPKVKSGIELRWNGSKGAWEKLLKTGWKTVY